MTRIDRYDTNLIDVLGNSLHHVGWHENIFHEGMRCGLCAM